METHSLYFLQLDPRRAVKSFNPRVFENTRQGMVSSSLPMSDDSFYIRTPDISCPFKASVSIVICTYKREDSLIETLYSLSCQTYKDFEVIIITEKGDLSALRDKGLRASTAPIVTFLDDDVYCEPTWLQAVVNAFKEESVVGVTGPTFITEKFKENRDCFRFKNIRKFQERVFKVPTKPGHLSVCGAPSMASNFQGCDYNGDVQYLECCNMSVKRKEAIDVGGFDLNYISTSEWCELDLSMRLLQKGRNIFAQEARIEHRPSKSGIYTSRLKTKHRWQNFMRFQKKWVKSSLLTYTYRVFIWIYLKLKNMRMI